MCSVNAITGVTPAIAPVTLETPQGSVPLKYSIERVPDYSDPQVAATISRMCQYVCADCQTYPIKSDAQSAVALNPSDPLAGIHQFVKSRMEFCRDETLAEPYAHLLPKDGYFVEALNRPVDVSFKYAATGQRVKGDCDCHCMYCAALLKALDIDCCFATVGADANDPSVFSHVYVVAYWRGQRVPLDCSHGEYAGWETENKYGKFKEWPVYDHAAWGSIAVGALLAGWFLWKNRKVFA